MTQRDREKYTNWFLSPPPVFRWAQAAPGGPAWIRIESPGCQQQAGKALCFLVVCPSVYPSVR